jgi:hypothetical protein
VSGLVLDMNQDPYYGNSALSIASSSTRGSDLAYLGYSVMQHRFTPSAAVSTPIYTRQTLADASLEASAYDALARAKVWTLRVATHLKAEDRKKLFRDLDRLHDISEWESGDVPMSEASFQNYLRMILRIRPQKSASLGLSSDGNIFAIWGTATDRITLEFLADDEVKWVLSYRDQNGSMIRTAGVAPADRILSLLSPYNPEHWFYDRQQDPR